MKRQGFTLVEMMVVVAVIIVLMSIVFRIGNVGSDSERRAATVNRIQRVENALSGYFAAFGAYPAVRLHGSRNIYLLVSQQGIQNTSGQEKSGLWGWCNDEGGVSNGKKEAEAWAQVEPACRSQPFGCAFPFCAGLTEWVDQLSLDTISFATGESEAAKNLTSDRKSSYTAGFDDGVSRNIGRFSRYRDEVGWSDLQLFKFGLMSFLLPRYMVMMNGDQTFFTAYRQWTDNNTLPSDPLTGNLFNNWPAVQDKAISTANSDIARVANIPSQAACARWIANFENLLYCNHPFVLFGVNVNGTGGVGQEVGMAVHPEAGPNFPIYSPGGYEQSSTSGQYVLDSVTLMDGWGNELYYYSPEPHQSYRVWSSGRNGRTFPPWINRESLDASARRCASYWTQDDIVGLKN